MASLLSFFLPHSLLHEQGNHWCSCNVVKLHLFSFRFVRLETSCEVLVNLVFWRQGCKLLPVWSDLSLTLRFADSWGALHYANGTGTSQMVFNILIQKPFASVFLLCVCVCVSHQQQGSGNSFAVTGKWEKFPFLLNILILKISQTKYLLLSSSIQDVARHKSVKTLNLFKNALIKTIPLQVTNLW